MNDPIVDRVVARLYADTDDSYEGMQVARRYAAWHLGDPDWANSIIDAYLNPATAREELDEEQKRS